MKRKFNFGAMLLIGATSLSIISCDKDNDTPDPDPSGEGQYFTFSMRSDDASYFLTTNSLMDGTVSTQNNGMEHTGRGFFLPSEKFLYEIDESKQQFFQYEMKSDGEIVEGPSILATQYIAENAESRNIVDDGKYLLVMDPIKWGSPEVKWLRIKLPEFVVEGSGTVTLPLYNNDPLYWVNVGNTVVHGDKLVMGSVYYTEAGEYAPGSHAIIFDWPSMGNAKVISSEKTGQLGTISQSNYAKDANGNLYIAVGCDDKGQWDKPSIDKKQYGGLLRIKAGESDFDADYFLDFTQKMGGNTPTNIFNIFSFKDNKAVAYLYNCKDVGWKQINDNHGYFATVDLTTGDVTKHTMPLSGSRTTRKAMVYSNKFYSFIKNAAKNTTHVIEVDPNGGPDAWKLGAQIEGANTECFGIAAHPSK